MPFDQSFLKLYEADSASEQEDGEPSAPAPSVPVDNVLSLDAERFRRQRTEGTSGRLGDDIVYFGAWDPSSANSRVTPEQIDEPESPEPTPRFRRLYAQKRQEALSKRFEGQSSPTGLDESGNTGGWEKLERFRFASEEFEHFQRSDSAFSVVSYTEVEEPEPPTRPKESPLKIFDERSDSDESLSDAAARKETIFGLTGEIRPPEPTFASPDEIALVESLPAWPRGVARLLERGKDAFSALAEIVRSEIERERRILGFGGTRHAAGTSTLLLGLTRELVQRHYSVLVIDADFERPSLARLLGLNRRDGWENFLPGKGSSGGGLTRVRIEAPTKRNFFGRERPLSTSAEESFFLMPLSAQHIAAAVTVSCRRAWLGRLLELADRFDAVLIDHGVLLTGDDERKVGEMLRFGEDGWFLIDDIRSKAAEKAQSLIDVAEERDLPCLGKIDNYL